MSTTPDIERWRNLRTLFRRVGAPGIAGRPGQVRPLRLEARDARGADSGGCQFTYEDDRVRIVKTVSAGERPFELDVDDDADQPRGRAEEARRVDRGLRVPRRTRRSRASSGASRRSRRGSSARAATTSSARPRTTRSSRSRRAGSRSRSTIGTRPSPTTTSRRRSCRSRPRRRRRRQARVRAPRRAVVRRGAEAGRRHRRATSTTRGSSTRRARSRPASRRPTARSPSSARRSATSSPRRRADRPRLQRPHQPRDVLLRREVPRRDHHVDPRAHHVGNWGLAIIVLTLGLRSASSR